MKTTDCRNTRREIDSSELDQRLSDKAVAHIAGCKGCRETLDQGTSLRKLVNSFETVNAPPDFDMRLRARLAAEKTPAGTWINLWRQASGVPAFALALSLLLIVAIAIYWRPAGTQQSAGTLQPAAPSAVPTDGAASKTAAANAELASGTQRPGDQTGGQTSGSSPIIPAAGRRDTPAGARRQGRSSAELAAVAKRSGIASREFSTLPAQTIKRPADETSTEMSPVVSLSAPVQPVVVGMRDDHGAKRTISLPPVSFGSQRLVQTGYQSALQISSAKGVW